MANNLFFIKYLIKDALNDKDILIYLYKTTFMHKQIAIVL